MYTDFMIFETVELLRTFSCPSISRCQCTDAQNNPLKILSKYDGCKMLGAVCEYPKGGVCGYLQGVCTYPSKGVCPNHYLRSTEYFRSFAKGVRSITLFFFSFNPRLLNPFYFVPSLSLFPSLSPQFFRLNVHRQPSLSSLRLCCFRFRFRFRFHPI